MRINKDSLPGFKRKKKEFVTLIVCKNVIKNFVAITLLLKELIVLLKKAKYNFI